MITRRSLRIAAFACAAGLAGAACGGTSGGDDSAAADPAPEAAEAPSTDPAPADASAESGVVVPASLQFTAPLVGGGEIVGDELAGKPTAFWFWSPT